MTVLNESSHNTELAGQSPKDVHSTVQKAPRETVGRTQSEAPRLFNASKRRKLVASLSSSSWSITRRYLQRDGEQTTEMQNLVGDGCRDKSIIEDLKQKGVFNVLSEESKRKLEEMANIELYERSEIVRTTQCPKEGTIYCGCEKCLIHSRTR